jgi:phosphohistidine phosphatase
VPRLILFRHAKSAWPEGVADHDRPLGPRGQQATPLMARWLVAAQLRPDLVLVSSARRTRETWSLIASEMPGIPSKSEPRIYEASYERLLGVLRALPVELGTVMMVGHNPGMQELALALSSGLGDKVEARMRLRRKYPTAGVAVLDFDGDWAELIPGVARLTHFQTPAMLGGIDED